MKRTALRNFAHFFLISVASVALASCGGGGNGGSGNGGGSPVVTPPNSAPTFTSGNAVSVAENTSGTIYTATASDADNDAVVFSRVSGGDANAFTLSASGALAFAPPPNFDLPKDADQDNNYQVSIQVSDGKGGTAVLALTVTVTNSREGIAVRRIATQFNGPVDMAFDADGTTLLIGERDTTVYRFDPNTGSRSVLSAPLAIPGARLLGVERGFAPALNAYRGTFILYQLGDGRVQVRRVNSNFVDIVGLAGPGTQTVAGTLSADRSTGELFAAVGDPSGDLAQNDSSGFGKLFRIRANPDPYAGATANFFLVSQVGKGIREPSGSAPVRGLVWFSDRGASLMDEINEVSTSSDRNFGWPFFEGTMPARSGGPDLGNQPPPRAVIARGNDRQESRGLTGLAEYTGPITSLFDQLVFGDRSGAIFSFPLSLLSGSLPVTASAIERRTEDFVPDVGQIDSPVAFLASPRGVLYILDGDGEIFRVEGSS